MTEQKEIYCVDENGEINHDAKMSEKFRYFIYDDEMSGTEDIIREANDKVADGNIEVQTWLDEGYGAKYFYECMRLARAVIISFENESKPTETFKVGEYYKYDDTIFKVLEDGGTYLKTLELIDKTLKAEGFYKTGGRYEKSVKATDEQIALFKRAEHFHSKNRKLNEFKKNDVIIDQCGDYVVVSGVRKSAIDDEYACEVASIETALLIMTAEELEAAATEVKG